MLLFTLILNSLKCDLLHHRQTGTETATAKATVTKSLGPSFSYFMSWFHSFGCVILPLGRMQWNFSQNVWDSNIIFHSAIKAGNVFLSFHFVSFRYALLCFGNFVFDFDAENAFVKLRRWPRCVCVSNWSIWWLLLQFHILYVIRGLCQLHFTCQRIVSFWPFFVSTIIGTHVIFSVFHPRPAPISASAVAATAYLLFRWLETFSMPFNFRFSFTLIRITARQFAVWVSHLMWKLNGWLSFMSGVIW